MSKKVRRLVYVLSGLFLFYLDQSLKWLIHRDPSVTGYLWSPWIGWEYYANHGIAFSLPFPHILLIFLIPITLIIISLILLRENQPTTELALILLLAGAVSNFIDRWRFGITIDYLRLFTAVINLADIMIGVAILILLFSAHKTKGQSDGYSINL